MFNLFKKKDQSLNNSFKIQSFTFFIPAPPSRATGYREKQFDKLFYEFINRGYELLSFHTESCTGQNQSGMWVVAIVRATNEAASNLKLEEFLNDKLINNNLKDQSPIEGLYHIDEITGEKI